MVEVALIVAGGDPPPPWTISRLHAGIVIAADGGADAARVVGLEPDVVIGDLDSASADTVEWARSVGARVVEYPSDKDKTDLELALDEAEQLGVGHVVVVGTSGGRTDHFLANWSAVCAARPYSLEVRDPGGVTHVVTGFKALTGRPRDPISLLPWGGPATGVTTQGLRWELTEATMSPFASLGVSNEFVGAAASVRVESGVLLAVLPVDY